MKFKSSLSKIVTLSSVFKYGQNMLYLVAANVTRTVTSLIFTFLLAREYGPSQFGAYSFVLSLVILISIFPFLGLQNICRRELVEFPENKSAILGTCGTITFVSSLVILFIFIIGIKFYLTDPILNLMALIMGGSILLTPFRFIPIWYEAQIKGQLIFFSTFVGLIASLLLKLLCIYSNQSIVSFSIIFTFEFLLLGILSVGLYKKFFCRKLVFDFDLKLAKKLLNQSWPLILTGFSATAAIRIDQIMIGHIEGNNALGVYAAASRVSMTFYVIPQIVALSLFPAIINSSKKEVKEKYFNKVQCFFDLNVALAYLVIGFVVIFSPQIINLIYGDEYRLSANVLSIHVWSNIFFFLAIARSQFCVAESLLKFEMLSNLFGCILNISLNLILIPSIGIIGAAYATIISQMVSVIFLCFLYKKTFKLGFISLNALYLKGLIQSILRLIK